ncbi:MAG: 50S ribosomal protein L21 [Thermacetogeniaceae bacterium]|nr:50S ribosomal protein L21 [Syntrophomonadaceae bacterium]
MFAIVETGGKQYKVSKGTVLRVEKLDAAVGDEVVFDKVLAVDMDGDFKVGTPYLPGAQVKAKVLNQGKSKKILVFKYKPKKNYRRLKGHRQLFTEVIVEEITLGAQENTAAAE